MRKPKKPITFPCLEVQPIPSKKIVCNDYNPNSVAPQEMELLAVSIEEDGVTQPCVVVYDAERDVYVMVDGFHRYTIVAIWFACEFVPCVVLNRTIQERMAATVRHNRARGKHAVDLMAELVASLLRKDWKDTDIAKHLGMEAEEVLRLKSQTGYADLFKHRTYSRSWKEQLDADGKQTPDVCGPVDLDRK